jgi:transmembrane sensor
MKAPAPETIDAAAARWAVRRRAGLDGAGERELAAWLAATPGHAAALRRLEAVADAFRSAREQGAAPRIAAGARALGRRRRVRRATWLAGGGMAAALAGALFLSWPRLVPPAGALAGVAAARADESIQRLADGSIVELEPGASIDVQFDAGVRRVALARGAALFRVASEAARPFVVAADGTEVRAVGTTFQVRLGSAAIAVLVTEGRVRVEDAATRASVLPPAPGDSPPLLRAGERAEIARGSVAARVAAVSADEIARELAWRAPRLAFEGAPLGDVVRAINRRNRVQIALASDSLAALRLSGDFAPDDPETFARLAAAALGLAVRPEPAAHRLVLARP